MQDFFIHLRLSDSQIRIFLGSLIITFVMVSIQLAGILLPNIVSPLSNTFQKPDVMEIVVPKLQQRTNDFRLKNQAPLVAKTYASGAYDDAYAYAVVDFDSGEVIAEKNLKEQVSIASITKVMTAVVALDLASPEEEFVVSEEAAAQLPTKIGVIPQQRMMLRELLEASLLTSANDAVEVIREGIDNRYGEPVFMRAMNEKAAFLGLKNTHFENPQGFDGQEHYSSAEDLALLTHYAMSTYPLVADIVRKDYALLEANDSHKKFDLYNWNGLIGVYPDVKGVKIGNTGRAKKTTVVLSEREGKKMLVVLLGAPGVLERDMWTAELLDLGYEEVLGLPCVCVTEEQLREKYSTWQFWN